MKTCAGDVLIGGRVIGGDWIDIYADEDLIITAALTAGSDLDLYAKGSLTTANASATLTAGMDVELETRWGHIELWGAVSAGSDASSASNTKHCGWYKESPDVSITSGSKLYLYGAITSLDDVELYTRSDLQIFGTVRAGDDFYAYARGDIEVSAGIEAFDRIHLWARGDLTLESFLKPLKSFFPNQLLISI
jgi:hypothetical protein